MWMDVDNSYKIILQICFPFRTFWDICEQKRLKSVILFYIFQGDSSHKKCWRAKGI